MTLDQYMKLKGGKINRQTFQINETDEDLYSESNNQSSHVTKRISRIQLRKSKDFPEKEILKVD